MIIKILGQKWKLNIKKLPAQDGYTDGFGREICIEQTLVDRNPKTNKGQILNDLEAVLLHVIRHEVTHAYLAESGAMVREFSEEGIVDWIATQTAKIEKTSQKVYKLLSKD